MATATDRTTRQKRTPHEQMLALLRKHAGIRPHEVTDIGRAGWPTWSVRAGRHEVIWSTNNDGRTLSIRARPLDKADLPEYGYEAGSYYDSPQKAVKAVTVYSRYAANYAQDSVGYDEAAALPANTAVTVTLGWRRGNGFVPEVAVQLTRYVQVGGCVRCQRVTARTTDRQAVHLADQYLDHDIPLPILLDWFQDRHPELAAPLALPAAVSPPERTVALSRTGTDR